MASLVQERRGQAQAEAAVAAGAVVAVLGLKLWG